MSHVTIYNSYVAYQFLRNAHVARSISRVKGHRQCQPLVDATLIRHMKGPHETMKITHHGMGVVLVWASVSLYATFKVLLLLIIAHELLITTGLRGDVAGRSQKAIDAHQCLRSAHFNGDRHQNTPLGLRLIDGAYSTLQK